MLLVRGGDVVRAAGVSRADVLVDKGLIAAVGPELEAPADTEVVDAGGALVIPGGIDVHTHFDRPVGALRSADDFESGTLAAACGGTTCVIDVAGAGLESPQDALAEWHHKAQDRAAVDYAFHLTVTDVPHEPSQAEVRFRWFVSEGVTSVKLYLAHPDRLMVDDGTLARALAAGKATGVLVCVHAESGLEAARVTEDVLARDETGPEALPLARPAWIEAEAIRRSAALAARAEAPLYAVHLSSTAGLEAVRESRGLGARVLAETCPQYLELTADRLRSGGDDAQDYACSPPLREDADREALWAALGHDEIQAISTAHCPFTRADRRAGVHRREKRWKDFTEIPAGLPGVETRVALAYQGVVEGRFDAPRWVDLVATTPARLFGLDPRKGDLAPGLDADLVVFDPEATKRLDADALHMRTDHSPYEGRTITGWPALTLSRGRPVARDGEPVDDRPLGRFVPRRPRA